MGLSTVGLVKETARSLALCYAQMNDMFLHAGGNMRRQAVLFGIVSMICLLIEAGCSVQGITELNERIAKGDLGAALRIGMDSRDVEKVLGTPKQKLNYLGMGYYAYDNVGTFFDNVIVEDESGNSTGGTFLGKVEAICWFGDARILNLQLNKTAKSKVVGQYGPPTAEKTFAPNEDGEGLMNGNTIIYRSGTNCLLMIVDEKGIVSGCYLAPAAWFL